LKYFIQTYGCQMNERDSETIAGILEEEMGYQAASGPEEADLIVVNTCCVRESAENRIYGSIGQLKRYKYKNPNLLIAVCGCMAQEKETPEKIRKRVPHVDLVFGTHNLHQLPELVRRAQESGEMVVDVWESAGEVREHLPARRGQKFKAWVNITFGCNNFCSYCIVPYVRGRERSRRPEEIVREVDELARDGCKEVTLLGQNVNSYGSDLEEGVDFAELLRRLDKVEGIQRIRFMTSHPRDFTTEMVQVIADSEKVCEHFHLPLQAGSNSVLRRMNRGYTRERYLKLVDEIRRLIPSASITTDLIVGFPGETEKDFEDTLDMVRRVEFDNAFTFIYSPRLGTAAARMPDQVPEPVKKERLERLMTVQYPVARRKNEALVGATVSILGEGKSKTNAQVQMGRTRTNKIVLFESSKDLTGRFGKVRIEEAKTWTLTGRLVD